MNKLPKKLSLNQEGHIAVRLLKKFLNLHIVKLALLVLIIALVSPIILFFMLKPEIIHEINYGVTFSKKYAMQLGLDWQDTYLKTLYDLGAKNLRLIAYWDEIEKQPGVYDFSDVKWQLDVAKSQNAKVLMTIGRKVPRYPECFEPAWWHEIKSEELQNYSLYKYIEKAVTELKDYENITMWQVENEPFFPFGQCLIPTKIEVVKKEIEVVKSLDKRPIMVQDSGEGGLWFPTYKLGDYLGISMYRKIWYDFWGVFLGRFIYFQYPLAHWTYKIKADLLGVPYKRIVVTELQAEPWGPKSTQELSQEEKDQTMSRHRFIDTINYAQKTGFTDLYFWGVEWWIWEKTKNNNPFYFDTAAALFK